MPFPIALAAAAALTGGQIMGNIFSAKAQRKHSRQMSDLQYQRDKEMFYEAQAYNSPAEQMKRFKEAGLNPHLIYSQGDPGNVAQTMPKYNRPTSDYPTIDQNFMGIMSQYQDLKYKAANTEYLDASASLQAALAEGQGIKNQLEGINLDIATSTKDDKIELTKQQVNKIKSEIENIAARTGLTQQQASWAAEKIAAYLNEGKINIDRDGLLEKRTGEALGPLIDVLINVVNSWSGTLGTFLGTSVPH